MPSHSPSQMMPSRLGASCPGNTENLMLDEPALSTRMASLTVFPLVTCQQQRDRAGTQSCQCPVGAACQDDRHARAEHDAGHLCLREVLELLRQHVAGFEVRHHEDVGP